jgi:hypothetical protein
MSSRQARGMIPQSGLSYTLLTEVKIISLRKVLDDDQHIPGPKKKVISIELRMSTEAKPINSGLFFIDMQMIPLRKKGLKGIMNRVLIHSISAACRINCCWRPESRTDAYVGSVYIMRYLRNSALNTCPCQLA